MYLDPPTRAAMQAAIPQLRAFAISLCRNADQADDLMQETLLRACSNIGLFKPGTNMGAWLLAILRNEFYSEYRKRRREIRDVDGAFAETLVSQPSQEAFMAYRELRTALAQLPDEMREALILVAGSGLSCAEAARICGCAEGTIKSRVHRARARLGELLSLEGSSDLAGDPILRSIAAHADHLRSYH
jgi:RNA polymerase sigma-70 factor (ECF subfamily)